MKKNTLALSTLILALAACGGDDQSNAGDDGVDDDAGDVDPDQDAMGSSIVTLSNDITTDTVFTADKTYRIPTSKYLYVKNGATLTIEPGTRIEGGMGSVLVITRGSKIMAEGTASSPIILTTDQPSGTKTAGYWGGLLVLGSAKINVKTLATPAATEATYEAFTSNEPEGVYGGTNDADNSGVIKYVHIEFAGFSFIEGREFNNLTLCGVGSGTTVDFVQLHGGSDDGVELFGGTVNLKHIVSTQNQDDGFDLDNGWNGKAQFIVVQNVSHPVIATDATNGYEADNHADALSYTATPRTLPTIYNVTLIGDRNIAAGGSNFAAVFRRGTGGHYVNHIWVNFQKGIEFRDTATREQLDSGNLEIKNSMLFGNGTDASNMVAPQANNDIVESTYLMAEDNDNTAGTDPGLPASTTSLVAPVFKPNAGAAALTGGATPPSGGFFDVTATFRGAVGTDDWTTGWTSYPQN